MAGQEIEREHWTAVPDRGNRDTAARSGGCGSRLDLVHAVGQGRRPCQGSAQSAQSQSGSSVKVSTEFAAAWGQAENKVVRGGSWNNNWNNVRAANRNNNTPSNSNNNIGFRCVGVAPGEFLKSQVRLVHEHGASAEREKVQVCSRSSLL
jgi:hypothetical protein